jgi:hypothetical protein
MSLRKSPQLTPKLLAAARRNAQRSTGPRSPAAKQNSKLNALKHGAYVSAENQRQAMRALGEDPEKFEGLVEELRSAFAPSDALLERQVEDLAWLYWRRGRLERTLSGLRRRALQEIEERQHRRRQEMAAATFDASQGELLDWNLPESNDRGVALRLRLSYLGVIREEVKQGLYRPRQKPVLESIYEGEMGWRSQMIYALLYRFVKVAELPRELANNPHYVEDMKALGHWPEPPGEAERQELLGLLGEEMASAEEELAYEEKANEERVAIEREACLTPQGEEWNVLVRQEGSLDRSIDRKVKILLQLRKEADRRATAPASGDGGAERESVAEAAGRVPENGELVEAVGNIKIGERRVNVPENKGPGFENLLESSRSCSSADRHPETMKMREAPWGAAAKLPPWNPNQRRWLSVG